MRPGTLSCRVILALSLLSGWICALAWEPSGELEIHYINVGQGGCTLIVGPNGARLLYDFGARAAKRDIVPYLRDQIHLPPEEGLHYAIVSHRDRDHYVGYQGVVEAGYDVLVANYGPGSSRRVTKFIRRQWLDPAADTTAGAVRVIPLGLRISLGDGAEAVVMAANGRVYGEPLGANRVPSNENDRSVALFIHYRDFQYVLDGDLGAGPESCTEHDTRQIDVQTRVADALLREELMDTEHGLDVLHVAHHGSESSTSAMYYNLMRPEVGLISVGKNQGHFLHPRQDVVDRVLLDAPVSLGQPDDIDRASCVERPPLAALYQTEDGVEGCSSTGCTSFSGLPVGDIRLTTDGRTGYTIRWTGRVHGGRTTEPACRHFGFDESAPPGSPPASRPCEDSEG
jgi:beta-lactamase superfamily II metal-dependent hydrolase